MISPNDFRRRLVDRPGVSFLPKRLRAFRVVEWNSFPVTLLVKLAGKIRLSIEGRFLNWQRS